MESTEKRAKPPKDKETKIIQLGHASSTLAACLNTCPGTSDGGGEDVKSIDTGRERRRRKQSVIVERDDGEYR